MKDGKFSFKEICLLVCIVLWLIAMIYIVGLKVGIILKLIK